MTERRHTITQLYGEPNTLQPFVTKEWNYRFLSNRQVVDLADRLSTKVAESDYTRVLFAQSGSSPFVEICDLVMQKKKKDIEWQGIKVPRETEGTIAHPLLHMLTDIERDEKVPQDKLVVIKHGLQVVGANDLLQKIDGMSRGEIVEQVASRIPDDTVKPELPTLENLLPQLPTQKTSRYHRVINSALEGCAVPDSLNNAFLFFDEYINSGRTLQQVDTYLNFLSDRPEYQTLSYYLFALKPERFPVVYETLFSDDTRDEYHRQGAYPYENRIDLIGHFYAMSEKFFSKMSVSEFVTHPTERESKKIETLFAKLDEFIEEKSLVQKVCEGLRQDDVKNYLGPDHVIRFLVYQLEKNTHGDFPVSQFLWQCFDMYGPCWSPLPTKLHFDFWNGFNHLEQNLDAEEITAFADLYENARPDIIAGIANEFGKRREAWQKRMKKEVYVHEGN